MQIHSYKTVLNHVNYGVRLCAACSMRCVVCGCPAFEFMQCAAVCGRAHGCVWECSSVRGSVRGSMRLSGSAHSSVHLFSGAAVCGSPAVSGICTERTTFLGRTEILGCTCSKKILRSAGYAKY
jgi:hypothetical protein